MELEFQNTTIGIKTPLYGFKMSLYGSLNLVYQTYKKIA